MEQDQVDFIDAESWQQSGDKLNIKIITLMYLQKIGKLCECEYRGGFYLKVETAKGEKEIYIEDSRERLCNAIEYLYNLLYPHFDDRMKTKAIAFDKVFDKLHDTFIKASSPEEEIVLGDTFYDTQKDKILLETYKQKKLRVYIKLFRQLNCFLKRNAYLQGRALEEKI